MKLEATDGVHLTYCTNIHPGETWAEVRAQLGRHLPQVKQRLSPDRPFGVGLRLSAVAAAELETGAALHEFQDFLAAEGLYVFTINGFPYGEFHGAPVKEKVYRPDWRDPARLTYTNRLADLLARLLPADSDTDGTVSTVPGGFRPDIATPADEAAVATNLIHHAAHLADLRDRTGRTIALALEPEPHCFIETTGEAIGFFENHLLCEPAIAELATLAGLSRGEAGAAMRRHLGLCVDLCHAAVEFEDATALFDRLSAAGIGVGKIQVTAGLRLTTVDAATIELLRPFDDSVYLHQVVERTPAGLTRYLDLPDAFAAFDGNGGDREWRVHCHVPVFLDDLGAFSTTQAFIREALERQRQTPVTSHLEVETYTWDVLPPKYRNVDIVTAIVRELEWTRTQLESGPAGIARAATA